LVATDVAYLEGRAVAAAVVFGEWSDSRPSGEYLAVVDEAADYVPGQLYRRELPALLAVLERIQDPVSAVVVDGYVRLGAKPGLGAHLWEAIGRRCAVIGVAKSAFRGADAVEVYRGTSRRPLYVSAAGADDSIAASNIAAMYGPDRTPVLLRRVDRLARDEAARVERAG
jgi:deoxyribonuclease V